MEMEKLIKEIKENYREERAKEILDALSNPEFAPLVEKAYGWDTWLFQDDFTLCTWHRVVDAYRLSCGDIVIFTQEYDEDGDEIVWYAPELFTLSGELYPDTEEARKLKEDLAHE